MKSLNRTLSLVLVLAMCLGLMGVASAAAFTDKATVQYTEAVNVMTGIGAINGYSDGSFKPTGTITREEAAKMITYAILGPTVAKTLSVTATGFKDVDAARWSAPFIAYCTSKGIINGLGDGTFNPTGNVTGYQLAKMMLCAAGYGKQGEFTGASWELNVAISANKLGVFTGSKSANFSTSATREEAALYVFNALTKVELVVWSKTDEVYKAYDGTFTTPADTTIAKNVYSTLTVNATTVDSFGRPASVWKSGVPLKTISSVASTPIAKFTGKFTSGALYTAMGENGFVYDTNAMTTSAAGTAAAGATGTTKTFVATAGDATTVYGGNGVLTELYRVYTSATAYYYKTVQIAPSFAAITAVTNTPATSTSGAYTTYAVGGLTGKVYSTVVNADVDVDTAVVTGTVALGDKVLYYKDTDGTLYIEAVSTFSGVLSSISSLGVYTVDGAAYKLAAAGTAPTVSTTSQTFYKDSYGYILGTKAAASVTNYAAVIGYKTTYTMAADNTLTPAYIVTVVKADGTTASLPVSATEYADWDTAGEIFTLATYTTYVDTTTGATLYNLTAGATGAAVSTLSDITNKDNTPTVGAGSVAYLDASTLFIAVNYNATTGLPTGTVTTYTGIANVPSYTSLTKTWAVDTNAVAADSVANVVFIIDNKSAVASDNFVYLTGTYTTNTSGMALDAIVAGKAGTYTITSTAMTTTAALYTQCVDGATYVAGSYYTKAGNVYSAASPDAATFAANETNYYTFKGIAAMKGLYSSFTVSSGVVTAATPAVADVSAAGTSGIKVSSNLFYTTADNGTTWTVFSTPYIADAIPVYVIHTVSGTVDATTASAVTSLTYASAVYVSVPTTTIAAVYVFVAN